MPSGGLMQLVSYGSENLYLTGNPQITFFKTAYQRHTNFAYEWIPQYFDPTLSFNIYRCYNKLFILDRLNGDWFLPDFPSQFPLDKIRKILSVTRSTNRPPFPGVSKSRMYKRGQQIPVMSVRFSSETRNTLRTNVLSGLLVSVD